MPDFNLSPPARFLSLAGALSVAGLAAGSPAAAAAGGAYYSAELANPSSEARFVARDVIWVCKGAACRANQGTSRPLIICSALAKAAGPVASFAAGGKALDAGELARCNAAK